MLPKELHWIILGYAEEWLLLYWVKLESLSIDNLFGNPKAADYLIRKIGVADLCSFSRNPSEEAFLFVRGEGPGALNPDELAFSKCQAAVNYACDNIHVMVAPNNLSANPLALP